MNGFYLPSVWFVLASLCIVTTEASYDGDNVFDLVYQTSSPYGLLPTVYFLSTYDTYYTNAEEACEALGGHLAEINSPSELAFVSDFIRDSMSIHEFIHISGYRNRNTGPLVSSRGVDLVAIINDAGSGNSNSNSTNNPLYFDYFPRYPSSVNNPPACLELGKRGNNIRMVTSRCDRSINRYICEKPLTV
ncbi:hypothetical protein PoB_003758600 [Plakobranchus ocellatus]|uniref:C-type lectin domain-containing protein n=1 Tax=Plakobranchus ocellatus TaxID=259542 RepID=A0AAV4AIS9_9GAST|nr:hypothetical protein PoB_003758600 [Plakobranchus ocellatus]